MGGPANVERQHAIGKLTVRERIDRLLDPGSFHEIGALAGQAGYQNGQLVSFIPSNFVMGTGRIDGRRVVVAGDDTQVISDSDVGAAAFGDGDATNVYADNAVLGDGTIVDGGDGDIALNQGDGVHPTAAGVEVMVKGLLPKAEELVARVRSAKGG